MSSQAAPVHHPTAQEISDRQEENYRESIWKDFPPLQLPPVHLPVSSHMTIRHTIGDHKDSKENGHGGGYSSGGLGYTIVSPGKTAMAVPGYMQYPGQYTVMDEAEDHPGRRKNSGLLQPLKHLSGRTAALGCLIKLRHAKH